MQQIFCHPLGRAAAAGTPSAPTTLAEACRRVQDGDTLFLKTAYWDETVYHEPLAVSGKRGVRVQTYTPRLWILPSTLARLFERYGPPTAVVDGEGKRPCVSLAGCEDFALNDVFARNSAFSVFSLDKCRGGSLNRCCGWNAGPGNHHVFGLDESTEILHADCFGGGTGRKIFQPYKSVTVTYRRCYGEGGGYTQLGPPENAGTPTMVFSMAYNSRDVLAEQCLATWRQTATPAGSAVGLFACDANEAKFVNADGSRTWPVAAHLVMRACTAFTLPGVPVRAMGGGIFNTGFSDVLIEGCNSITVAPTAPMSLGMKEYGGEDCRVSNIFLRGSTYSPKSKNWDVTYSPTPNPIPEMNAAMARRVKKYCGVDVAAQVAALKKLLEAPA